MKYKANDLVKVSLSLGSNFYQVGRLALKNHKIWFEYDKEFLSKKLEISPFKLPLKPGVFSSPDPVFDGLFGVFNDSLPDAWGKLLLDRKLREQGIDSQVLTPLDRLVYLGKTSLGALSYEPANRTDYQNEKNIDLDLLALESQTIIAGESSEAIEELLELNSSIGGARPKITISLSANKKHLSYSSELNSHEDSLWIIKFPATTDNKDIGAIEYAYSLIAKDSGIEMPETFLFPSKNNSGYFGIKRFDREGFKRYHIHSASGLLHADYNYPSLDYENLLRLCLALTKNQIEVEKIFRLAVFNVLAHNRDDHSKNFSFIMDENGNWKFAPAYDLVFSYGPGREHSMMICGEGLNPGKDDLMKLAKLFNIKSAKTIYEQVSDAVSEWDKIAKKIGMSKNNRLEIQKHLK